MNRRYNQFRLSLEKSIVDLYAQVTIGATGAPTLVAASSKGIASISRSSAGDYVLTLSDKYVGLLDFSVITQNATGISASADVGIKAQSVASAKTIEFVCSTGGVATDPASGDRLFIKISLKASTAF